MNIQSSHINFERGQIIQQAHVILDIWYRATKTESDITETVKLLEYQMYELDHLVNNVMQNFNTKVLDFNQQLARCEQLIMMVNGYVPGDDKY